MILNGCRTAGITKSRRETREKNENSVNLTPFSKKKVNDIVFKYNAFCSSSLSENRVLL